MNISSYDNIYHAAVWIDEPFLTSPKIEVPLINSKKYALFGAIFPQHTCVAVSSS